MAMGKSITVGGKPLAGGKQPLICAPLVGGDEATVLREIARVAAKQPDLIEWRVDFFTAIADVDRVLALASEIRNRANGIPIIFTRRSPREGGEPTGLPEDAVPALYQAVCTAAGADFVDFELSSDPWHFQAVRRAARDAGMPLIASYHDFRMTPPMADIVAKFVAMEDAGADIAKIAVMPRTIDDVLTLLGATLEANRRIRLPLIGVSMGAYGALSRLFGWTCGSSVTFAVGEKASAPGQVPIDDLRTVAEILQRALADEANRP